MAKTTEQLVIEIRAQADKALADMKRLEAMADELEKGVDIDVNIDTAGARVAQELVETAQQMATELDQAKVAAERLGQALGPELAGRVDMNQVLGEFKRLGLTMDDVAADADELAAAVKAIDDVKVDAASSGLADFGTNAKGAKGDLDGISDSARGANSALANMIGNSAQDLGALGGAAGSVGVALGQMAEYAADATLGGEKLGSALKSMAGVALPIAGITIAIAAVNSVIGAYQRQAETAAKVEAFNVENVKDFVEWGRQGLDIVDELVNKAQEAQAIEVAPNADEQTEALKLVAEEGENLYDLLQRMKGQDDPFNMHTADEDLEDVSDALLAANENAESFFRAASDPGAFDAFVSRVKGSNLSLADQAELIAAVIYQRDQYAAGLADSAKDLALFGEETEDNTRAEEEAKQATDERAQAIEALVEAIEQAVIATAKANGELLELSSTFTQMGMRGDALSSLFSLGNAPEEAAAATRDIAGSIAGLAEVAKGVTLADYMAENLKADPLLDALDGLRGEVQAKVVETFSTGGPEAATAMAEGYIDQVFAQLEGMGLTREQVAQILGLDDVQATVQVALDLSSIESAKRQLAILVGIGGETPLTASVALALEAGTITGDQAQTIVQAALGEKGVEVPASLAVPTTDEAIAGAYAALGQQPPVAVPTTADPQGFAMAAGELADADLEPATVPIEGDRQPIDDTVDDVVTDTERESPVVDISGDTKKAIGELLLLRLFAVLLRPTVGFDTDLSKVTAGMSTIAGLRPRVPVDAYLADYPTAGEIQRAIGRPRIPVDIVVGSSIRITGVRD